MANDDNTNTYEESRKQRLLDNKKRFEDLGIINISKSLSNLSNSKKKSQQPHTKLKSRNVFLLEPRRSSRARNPVPSYRDEVDIGLPHFRKRSTKSNSSWASYLARPLDEVKTASYEERAHAVKCAEELQSNLRSKNPSFVKSMVRSHVYSCFWLGLPSKFCEDHLSNSTVDMVLEDESGAEYEATFIGKRTGLSGGWRAFALDHKLDDGDALVFELLEPSRFKVHIVRASNSSGQEDYMDVVEEIDSDSKKASNGVVELKKNNDAQPKRSTRSNKNENSTQAPARKRNRQ
uniref:TF-B3 domain-containing protein n=1 Tax=Davidia involucrata TaxID=16924 RepID=A0A5B7C7X2_DAVIN